MTECVSFLTSSKAIALNPDDRYQSALEMRRALEQIALKGYCTSNVNGDVVFVSGNKEYRFEIIPVTDKISNVIVYQKNQNSGRETKANKYCYYGLKNSEIKLMCLYLKKKEWQILFQCLF